MESFESLLNYTSLPISVVQFAYSKFETGIYTLSGRGEATFNIFNHRDLVNSSGDSPDEILEPFLAKRKRDAADEAQGMIDIRSFGADIHPHGTYFALAYTLIPASSLRYPILSQQSVRIALRPLVQAEDFDPVIVPVNISSPVSSWWEIKTIANTVSRDLRPEFSENIQKRVRELTKHEIGASAVSEITTSQFQQVLLEKFYQNPLLDAQRLLYLLSGEHSPVIESLAEVIFSVKESSNLGDLDRAVLYSLNAFIKDSNSKYSDAKGPVIKFQDKFFNEIFDFTTGTDKWIKSLGDHTWKRCSVTLLPLTGLDALTCGGCSRRKINIDSLIEHENNIFVSVLLQTLDICIYCGCRYKP